MKNVIDELKLKQLLKEEKKTNPVAIIFIVIGVLVVAAAAVYGMYRFIEKELLERLGDDYEDEFDEDFFEDEDFILDDSEDLMFEE